MVRRVSGVLRIWILVAAFAQAVMPGVASVVHATSAAAAAQAGVQAHIESDTATKCPRAHQEDTCALCRFVSGSVAISSAAEQLYAQSTPISGVDRTQQSPDRQTDGDPSLPRAPPTLA